MRASCHLSSLRLKLAKVLCVSVFCAATMVVSTAQTLTTLHSLQWQRRNEPLP